MLKIDNLLSQYIYEKWPEEAKSPKFISRLDEAKTALKDLDPTSEEAVAIDDELVALFHEEHQMSADEVAKMLRDQADKEKREAEEKKRKEEEEKRKEDEEKEKSEKEKADAAKKKEEDEAAERLKKEEEEAAERQKKTQSKENLIDLFKKKKSWDYNELQSIGVDVEKVGLAFSIHGYIFEKRQFVKAYSIVGYKEPESK